MIYKILLFTGIVFNVMAQLLLKTGMKGLDIMQTNQSLIFKIKKFALNPFFWGSLFCYGIGFLIYSIVISKVELSKAYPVASVTAIILIFIISVIFVNESFNFQKAAGVTLCIAGILIILW